MTYTRTKGNTNADKMLKVPFFCKKINWIKWNLTFITNKRSCEELYEINR